jgi:hypothetical protein
MFEEMEQYREAGTAKTLLENVESLWCAQHL